MALPERFVFAWCGDDGEFRRAATEAFAGPRVEFAATGRLCRGSTVYVALGAEDLGRYEPWFRGVTVRAAARLRHRPLQPGGALYLPVTYDSWVAVCDGPGSLGAAVEAARLLGCRSLVCPAFDASSVPAAAGSLSRAYARAQDHVAPRQ